MADYNPEKNIPTAKPTQIEEALCKVTFPKKNLGLLDGILAERMNLGERKITMGLYDIKPAHCNLCEPNISAQVLGLFNQPSAANGLATPIQVDKDRAAVDQVLNQKQKEFEKKFPGWKLESGESEKDPYNKTPTQRVPLYAVTPHGEKIPLGSLVTSSGLDTKVETSPESLKDNLDYMISQRFRTEGKIVVCDASLGSASLQFGRTPEGGITLGSSSERYGIAPSVTYMVIRDKTEAYSGNIDPLNPSGATEEDLMNLIGGRGRIRTGVTVELYAPDPKKPGNFISGKLEFSDAKKP